MEKTMSENLALDQISIYKKHFIKTNLPVKINEYTPLIYRINKLNGMAHYQATIFIHRMDKRDIIQKKTFH